MLSWQLISSRNACGLTFVICTIWCQQFAKAQASKTLQSWQTRLPKRSKRGKNWRSQLPSRESLVRTTQLTPLHRVSTLKKSITFVAELANTTTRAKLMGKPDPNWFRVAKTRDWIWSMRLRSGPSSRESTRLVTRKRVSTPIRWLTSISTRMKLHKLEFSTTSWRKRSRRSPEWLRSYKTTNESTKLCSMTSSTLDPPLITNLHRCSQWSAMKVHPSTFQRALTSSTMTKRTSSSQSLVLLPIMWWMYKACLNLRSMSSHRSNLIPYVETHLWCSVVEGSHREH